jgi:hypothetical protein
MKMPDIKQGLTIIAVSGAITVGMLNPSFALAKPVMKEVSALPYILDKEIYRDPRSKVAHRYEKHQYARTSVDLQPDGTFVIITRFENGKRLDGDNLYCLVEFLDAEGTVIQFRDGGGQLLSAMLQTAGLNPHRKRNVKSSGALKPEDAAKVHWVKFRYGHFDSVNDAKICRKSLVLAKAAGAIPSALMPVARCY